VNLAAIIAAEICQLTHGNRPRGTLAHEELRCARQPEYDTKRDG